MSKIAFYQTELTPQKNAWIEDIEQFIGPYITYSTDNFQYQKIQLEMDVVIPVIQRYVVDGIGNYCKIEQDGNKYFFFVLGADWASVNAVRLHLSLDTINTFGDKLVFDPRTMIQRQHEDRFFLNDSRISKKLGDGNTLLRKIDRENEGLTPIKDRIGQPMSLKDSDDETNWYLMYKTAKELSQGNLDNPIACYLFADKELIIEPRSPITEKELTFQDLNDGEYLYFNVEDNPQGSFKLAPSGPTYYLGNSYRVINGGSVDGGNPIPYVTTLPLRGLIFYRTDDRLFVSYQYSEPTAYFNGNKFIASFNSPNDPSRGGTVSGTGWVEGFQEYGQSAFIITNARLMRSANTLYGSVEAGILNATRLRYFGIGIDTLKTNTLKDIDRTDSRIMKIIKLPYAPTRISQLNGRTSFGPEWEYESGFMRLKNKDLSTEFESTIGQLPLYETLVLDVRNDPLKNKDMQLESKLYNSNFYTLKAYYDEFIKEIPLEDFQVDEDGFNPASYSQYAINVHFKPTNTINSKFAFKFDMDQIPNFIHKTQEDFEDFLLVNRNNEVAIFSNDYVNYMRSGYNYDKKAHDISQQQAVVNAVLGMAGAGAQVGGGLFSSYAQEKNRISHLTNDQLKQERIGNFVAAGLPKDDPRRTIFRNSAFASASPFTLSAGISMATSAIQSAVNIHYANASFENQMAGKQAQLKAQSSSVSGADDVDLLSYYCDNKLKVAEYEPKPLTKKAIYDLFYYTGYNHLTQAIPDLDSRFWFNFVQCDPVFKDENIAVYHEYLEDIKERFRLGVTKYHHRPNFEIEWNFNQDRENLENRLCEYDKVPSSKLSLGAINFVQRSQGNDVSVTWKNTHPLDNYTECLRFRYELGGKLTYIDTTRANQESIILFGAQGTSGIQVQRVDRWNSKFNSDWSNI